MNKSKIIGLIIFPAIVIACVGIVLLMNKLSGIGANPVGTVGNTTGNLQNNGTFAEYGNQIFFANPYDSNSLYVMNSDFTNIKKLNSVSIKYINVGEKYLYYYQYDSQATEDFGFVSKKGSLFREPKTGGRATCMKKNPVGGVKLIDDEVYYLNYDSSTNYTLYSIQTNKKNDHVVLKEIADPSCYADGTIYYVSQDSTENHHLFAMPVATEVPYEVTSFDVWNPQYQGGYIYYLDIHDHYHLCRFNPSTGAKETLINERIDCYNVTDNYIYFQVNSKENPYIGYSYLDGTYPTVLARGNYTEINIVNGTVFFHAFTNQTPLYYAPLGSTNVGSFTQAQQAVKVK